MNQVDCRLIVYQQLYAQNTTFAGLDLRVSLKYDETS